MVPALEYYAKAVFGRTNGHPNGTTLASSGIPSMA
jgi:hypothetical protein